MTKDEILKQLKILSKVINANSNNDVNTVAIRDVQAKVVLLSTTIQHKLLIELDKF